MTNDDSIVNLVHGGNYELYDKELKVLYKSTEMHIACQSIAIGRTVIVDRGLNGAVDSRKRWIALARSLDVPCDAVLFPFDGYEVHANRRFKHDTRGHSFEYWLDVVKAHRSTHADPTIEEGLNAVYSITFEEIQKGRVII